jgi:hypothetical protein
MKHELQPLETVNALVTEPSVAFGVEGRPDLAILVMRTKVEHWTEGLDSLVAGCLVLGFRNVILQMDGVGLDSSFQIACVVSAWQQLIEASGTLALCGLSAEASRRLQELVEPRLFNLFDSVDAALDWLESSFTRELTANFPRSSTCGKCGAAGTVTRRGDHMCPECGMTYLVTERGELLF